jgi:cytochrome c556
MSVMPRNLFHRNALRAAGSAIFIASLIAVAQAATPVETQKARHEHYEELGKSFKAVRDQMNAATPDFAVLEKNAQVVSDASVNQQQWFPKGTGPEAGKTRALPEIWSKPADFEAAQKMLSDRAPKLLAAVKSKDIDAVKAAFKETGGACKNCHDTFRSPEE